MALAQKAVDKIVKEKTYFKAGILVESGEVVYWNDKFVTQNDKDEIIEDKEAKYKNDEVLYVKYNEDVDRRIRDFLPRVLNQRGVTEPSDIDISHPHVQSKLKEIRRMPGRNKRTISEDEQIAIVEMVRKAHKPQYILALMQVILWAMVYDDLFDLSNPTGKGVMLDVKFDFEVPEDYWNLSIKEDKDKLLYELVTDAWKIDFKKYDKNNPLEMMLAFATTLIEEFPNISDSITSFQSNIVTAFTFSGGGAQFDDAGFLNAELDELLRKPNVRRNHTKQRENTDTRVRSGKQNVEPTADGRNDTAETEQA